MSELRQVHTKTKHRESWAVVGPLGAIEYWHFPDNPECGGVEQHSRTPIYENQKLVHTDCSLLDGKCWHDGSSLYASEAFTPYFGRPGWDNWIWIKLENEYHDRFKPEPSP